ncbi:DUF3304 domain-containing protein [Pseudomonas sp. SJZ131]|uniref:DUF3304 domain-containing protein n=1 Tax=Pseudomonas sp. SJZ131 TaxID=2572895 RepID=UPI00119A411E|nr:DUF3304 domain-containing protein [Pseudomonas sp. SJZ131]TWD47633.1 uncharacterized protein DUF3304 [Pseudomonas sp. SJZ131]
MLDISVTGFNHTSAAINWFSLNGAGGEGMWAASRCGSEVRCGMVPQVWGPGLSVKRTDLFSFFFVTVDPESSGSSNQYMQRSLPM